MAAIDQRERPIISQFRLRLADLHLKDEWSSDYSLIRWIRARDHDLNAAEKMLRKSFKWWRDNNIEQILASDAITPEYRMKYPYHIGNTRDNGVFLIVPMGRYDLKAASATDESREKILQYCYRAFAEVAFFMKDRKNSRGIPITQITLIGDFQGFSLASTFSLGVIQMIKEFAAYLDANEPERLEICYLLNASKFITFLLTLLKPVLARKTLAKFVVVNSGRIKCKEKLLEVISEDELPMLHGGKQANSTLNQFIT